MLSLEKKYPTIFEREHMLACGEGWHPLLAVAALLIKQHVDYHPAAATTIIDIKEKFGQLRISYQGGDPYVDGIITALEEVSLSLCEVCGSVAAKPVPGQSRGGWITTRCREHQR